MFDYTGAPRKSVHGTTCRATPWRSILSRLRRLRHGLFSHRPVFITSFRKDNNQANEGNTNGQAAKPGNENPQRRLQSERRTTRPTGRNTPNNRRRSQTEAKQNMPSAQPHRRPARRPHSTIRLTQQGARLIASRASTLHFFTSTTHQRRATMQTTYSRTDGRKRPRQGITSAAKFHRTKAQPR